MLHFSRDQGEDASVDDASMKLAEPALELVLSRRDGRIFGQIYVRTLLRAVRHQFRFVRGKLSGMTCTCRSTGCVSTTSSSRATNS
jgi:hypothetical protein